MDLSGGLRAVRARLGSPSQHPEAKESCPSSKIDHIIQMAAVAGASNAEFASSCAVYVQQPPAIISEVHGELLHEISAATLLSHEILKTVYRAKLASKCFTGRAANGPRS